MFFERTLHSPSASLYLGMRLGIGKHSAKPDKMLDGTLRGASIPSGSTTQRVSHTPV